MNAKFKLVVKQSKVSPYFTVRILPTASKAKIEDEELALDISLTIPDSLFKKPVLNANITIEDKVGREISASVATAIKEVIEYKFNVDVRIIK